MRNFMKKFVGAVALIAICVCVLNMNVMKVQAAPAPAVSSVRVVGARIKSDGYVYVTVQVGGYGKNIYATYDGIQCKLSSISNIGRPIVTGFLYEIKCIKATVGSHQFTFKITSVNSPWNTMSTRTIITVR